MLTCIPIYIYIGYKSNTKLHKRQLQKYIKQRIKISHPPLSSLSFPVADPCQFWKDILPRIWNPCASYEGFSWLSFSFVKGACLVLGVLQFTSILSRSLHVSIYRGLSFFVAWACSSICEIKGLCWVSKGPANPLFCIPIFSFKSQC